MDPKKKAGRPVKQTQPGEDEKLVKKRLYQRAYQNKIKQAVGTVLTLEEECDNERDALKKEVNTLKNYLNGAMNQLDNVLSEAKNMGASGKKKAPMSTQIMASSVINSAIKNKIARNKVKALK
jgi:hypothetical protein